MKKFIGVLASRSIGEDDKNKEENKMNNKRRSSIVGGFGSRLKNEGESKMRRSMSGMFGRKEKEANTKNEEENKMGFKEALINLDSKLYGVAHTVGFIVGVNGAEFQSGYQEAVSKEAEDTSVAPEETAEPVVVEEEMEMETFLEKVNAFFDDVKDELNEEVVADERVIEIKVERAKQVKTEEIEQLEANLASWGVKEPADVERKVNGFLHQVVKEDIENTPPTLALKAGRLTGLLVRRSKGLGAVATSKLKALGEGVGTYLEGTSYFNLFKSVNKSVAKAILTFTLPAWVINQFGLTVLAGWVATPAAMVIGLYPIIVAISLFSKSTIDASAVVEKKVKETIESL